MAIRGERIIQQLSKSRLLELEEDFKEYQQVNTNIAIRVVAIEHPWTESNGNPDGGRSSIIIKPQEILTIKKDEDKELQRLFNLKDDCEHAIGKMSDEQLMIYNMRFVNSDYLGWYEIADRLHYSVRTIYNKRYKMLELLAIEKGLISPEIIDK